MVTVVVVRQLVRDKRVVIDRWFVHIVYAVVVQGLNILSVVLRVSLRKDLLLKHLCYLVLRCAEVEAKLRHPIHHLTDFSSSLNALIVVEFDVVTSVDGATVRLVKSQLLILGPFILLLLLVLQQRSVVNQSVYI